MPNQDTPTATDTNPQPVSPDTSDIAVVPVAAPGEQKSDPSAWVMLLVYGGGASVYAAWQFEVTQGILRAYWPLLVMASVATIALTLLVKPAARTGGQKRVALVTFGVMPFVMVVVGAVLFLPAHYQVPALRWVFLVVVSLLPPTMYYLFIATRKYSLLKEFVGNLSRLGLLDPSSDGICGDVENGSIEWRRRLRVLAYLQKFEGVYGPLQGALMDEIRASGDVARVLADPRPTRSESAPGRTGTPGVAEVFSTETTPALVISTVLIVLGWLMVLPPWEGYLRSDGTLPWSQAFVPATTPVNYAFLGAYFFSLQMLFRRYVLRDLRASAYVAVALRIILAVLGTWVLVQAWNAGEQLAAQPTDGNDVLPVVAFVIGVFPAVAWQYVQSVVKKVTLASIAVPSLNTQLPISDLDGLTVWHQSRLEEEDIENVPNMATANLVDLMLNTRVPSDRIIDWVDQAILYTQIGADEDQLVRRQRLRACGIRTASALVDAYWRTADPKTLATSTEEPKPLEITVGALCTNPNLKLIQRWRCLPEEPVLRLPSEQPASHVARPAVALSR